MLLYILRYCLRFIILCYILCVFHNCCFVIFMFLSEFRDQPQFSVVKGASLCVILVFSSCLLTKFTNLRSFKENMILLNIQKKSKVDKEAATSHSAVFIWFGSSAPSSSKNVGCSFCSGEQTPSEHLS